MANEKKKIYVDARFKPMSDTLKNWQSKNPILLSGEPGVVIGLNKAGDGLVNETERIKFGDGVMPWNDLPWWKGPKGDIGQRGPAGDGLGRETEEGGEIFNAYEGEDLNKALGAGAHAEGRGTVAAKNAHAEGRNTKANGNSSHAEGNSTVANGNMGSHAEGRETLANADSSHAEGNATKANGLWAHAEGEGTQANGNAAHSEGYHTVAETYYAHAEGLYSNAKARASHAEGCLTIAEGEFSHAEGHETQATGSTAHAEGNKTQAIGEGSHAEGLWSVAFGKGSHAEGNGGRIPPVFTADSTFEEIKNEWNKAQFSLAFGESSHIEGLCNLALGDSAHVAGRFNIGEGKDTFVQGTRLIARQQYQVVFGKYNDNKEDTVFEIGNGTAENARSNIFEVYKDGSFSIGGVKFTPEQLARLLEYTN